MNAPPRSSVGIVGFGLLGSALGERLLTAGWSLDVFDRSEVARERAAALGARVGRDAHEVASRANRLLLSLPTSDSVRGVLAEIRPSLRAEHIVVDTTTGSPDDSVAFATDLASLGVRFLDATVVGSSAQARSGDIVVLAGGTSSAFDAVTELLGAISRRAIHVGPPGAGAQMKLVCNLVLGLNRAALAEGLHFAEELGLDASTALHVLMGTLAYSRIMDTKGLKMVDRDFATEARLSQHRKDVDLILAQARAKGAILPLSAAHLDLLDEAIRRGFGPADNSAVIEAYRNPPADAAPSAETDVDRGDS